MSMGHIHPKVLCKNQSCKQLFAAVTAKSPRGNYGLIAKRLEVALYFFFPCFSKNKAQWNRGSFNAVLLVKDHAPVIYSLAAGGESFQSS